MISLSGEIDVYTAPHVCRVLDAIDGPAIVDLSEVRILTAAGLRELDGVASRVGARTVRLTGARPTVRRVLSLVHFERLFTIDD